jgi:hypothetical protein
MKYQELENEIKLESFIRGSLLGDGNISYSSKASKEARMAFCHGLKQKEYINWKNNFLAKYNLNGKIYEYTAISNRYKSGSCTSISFKSKTNPIFSKFMNLYYNDKKIIDKKDIWNLDKFALAIWFMDDGSLWKGKKRSDIYLLNTQNFNIEDKQLLQKVLLSKFNIKTSILKHEGELRIALESMSIFYNLIKDEVLELFNYKLKWVHVKLGELGEQPLVKKVNTELS